ncbi:MAG TPA: DoxX family protein [Candidatus Solibacter sp.]|jgi:hypothetical protein|nr:DoxX family protein [Candidatus Solibacter sp.]
MNTILWILQGVLTATFLMVGTVKLLQPKDQLAARLAWVNDFSPAQVKGIGALEVLGAVGVSAPWALGVLTFFTPLGALGLAVLMLGAAVIHIRRSEPAMLVGNGVLLLLAAIVATGRAGLV